MSDLPAAPDPPRRPHTSAVGFVSQPTLYVHCLWPSGASPDDLARWKARVRGLADIEFAASSGAWCLVRRHLPARSQAWQRLAEIATCWHQLLRWAERLGLVCTGFVGASAAGFEGAPWWEKLALPGELLWSRGYLEGLVTGEDGPFLQCDDFEVARTDGARIRLAATRLDAEHFAAGWDTPDTFVGRRLETRHITERLDDVRRLRDVSRFLLLRGAAGLGKSTLMREAIRVARGRGYRVLQTHCVDYATPRRQQPLALLAESLLALGAVPSRESDEGLREKIARHSLTANDPRASTLFADLLDLPLLDDEQTLLSRFTTGQLSEARAEILRDAICAAAREQPTLLVVEDVHWAATPLLDVLGCALTGAEVLPLVALASTRLQNDPIPRHAVLSSLADSLLLGPLSSQESRELALQLFRDRRQPWQVRSGEFLEDEVLDRRLLQAAGNPLMLTQMLHQATPQQGGDRAPLTLESMLLGRLQRLSRGARRFLEVAACAGFFFSAPAILKVADVSAAIVHEVESSSFIHRSGDQHVFSHALIRDTISDAMEPDVKIWIHAHLADNYDDLALRAEHWSLAKDPRAYDAFLQAAAQRRSRYQWFEALSALERAASVAASAEDRAHALVLQGELFEQQGEGRQSLACFQGALELLDEAGVSLDSSAYVSALLGHLAAQRLLGQLDTAAESIELLDRQLGSKEARRSLPVEYARLSYLRGSISFARGQLNACERSHRAALAVLEERGGALTKHRVYAQALSGMGDALYAQGKFTEAKEFMRRCVDLARAQRFGRIEVSTLHMLGIVTTYTGDPRRGFALSKRCYEQACQVSDARATLLAELNMALPLLWEGRGREGRDYCEGSLQRAEWIGSSVLSGMARAFCAHIRLFGGDRARARRDSEVVLQIVERHGERLFGGVAYGHALALAASDPAPIRATAAREWLDAGMALLRSSVVSHNYLYFSLGAAPAYLRLGDRAGLKELVGVLRGFFRAELERGEPGCVGALVAWVELHLHALGGATTRDPDTLRAWVDAQPLLRQLAVETGDVA